MHLHSSNYKDSVPMSALVPNFIQLNSQSQIHSSPYLYAHQDVGMPQVHQTVHPFAPADSRPLLGYLSQSIETYPMGNCASNVPLHRACSMPAPEVVKQIPPAQIPMGVLD